LGQNPCSDTTYPANTPVCDANTVLFFIKGYVVFVSSTGKQVEEADMFFVSTEEDDDLLHAS
jgi:hypothetical protein